VTYLATVKPDGAPRLHPVRPVIAAGHIFLFMEPNSPKGGDLERDGRYVLHCTATGDEPWDLREFSVEGTTRGVTDTELRRTANAGSSFPRDDHFALIELGVTAAFSTVYGSNGQPQRQRWHAT
jgi:Pyridoxamine 5'-phosphate oxidase